MVKTHTITDIVLVTNSFASDLKVRSSTTNDVVPMTLTKFVGTYTLRLRPRTPTSEMGSFHRDGNKIYSLTEE